MPTIADLTARFRADTTDLVRGGQVAKQTLQGVEQQAGQTARALEIMAQAAAKANPGQGSAQQILEFFQRANVQPTATALAQAAKEMENTAAAATKIVEPTKAAARAAVEHAEGWKLSESQLVRFGTGLVGIGLGISLVGGAARALHDAISAVVGSQLDWERSLIQVRTIYGDLAPRVVALSQAQAALPGVISSQQELVQANTAAGFLTTRYGLSPTLTGRLTTQAAELGGLFAFPEPQRRGLQDAFLEYARSGGGAGTLESTLGRPFDPYTLSRRLGFGSEAGLQALTPAQLSQARSQLLIATAAQANIQGSAEQRGLLDAQRGLQQNLAVAQGALQNRLEGGAPDDERLRALITAQAPRSALEQQHQEQQLAELTARQEQYTKAVEDAQRAIADNAGAVADNKRQLDEATSALAKLGVEAGGTTARLLSFAGSLEDVSSIARGDVAAQAQGAVAARARMAVPAFGVTQGEIVATAQNTAYQNAYQNYVAEQAQQEQGNAIREELQRRIQIGPAAQRPAAARALAFAEQSEPIQQRLGQANRTLALADLATSENQARLEAITLAQRERGLQLMRETVDLRRLDVQQQQASLGATMNLVRAQQAALPGQYALADAQYTISRTAVLAQARTARAIQGKDVSGFPSIEDLIKENVAGQFAAAEAAPGALAGGRAVEMAQRTVTAGGLAQQLTEGQIRSAELASDLRNLADIPSQLALMVEGLRLDQQRLDIEKEQRDLQKDLVRILSGRSPSLTSGQNVDSIASALSALLFGDDDSSNTAPPDLPANRRGPS